MKSQSQLESNLSITLSFKPSSAVSIKKLGLFFYEMELASLKSIMKNGGSLSPSCQKCLFIYVKCWLICALKSSPNVNIENIS